MSFKLWTRGKESEISNIGVEIIQNLLRRSFSCCGWRSPVDRHVSSVWSSIGCTVQHYLYLLYCALKVAQRQPSTWYSTGVCTGNVPLRGKVVEAVDYDSEYSWSTPVVSIPGMSSSDSF